jgi:transposase
MLAGVAPIPANSGQVTTRYRLNRYGDRQLNNALHTVVQSRIQYQQAPATTSLAVLPKARPGERSNAALPATSPETSIAYLKAGPQRLDGA